MEHTRVETQHISPRVGDLLVSNLRAPMITFLEDTSPGTHDSLMAACDPLRYRALGVEKWSEHGSCAENLVSSLRELNQSVGLKGLKAIGGDITINHQPAPLNLFMNIPFAQDGELNFESSKGKRGDRVKFRAERDLVVVMSACPQDMTKINGKKPMVAHFLVDSPSEDDIKAAEERNREAQDIIDKARKRMEAEYGSTESGTNTPKAPVSPSTTASHIGIPKFTPTSSASSVPQRPPKLESRSSTGTRMVVPRSQVNASRESQQVESPSHRQPAPKPGRPKPRKIERRASGAPTPKS